MPLFKRKGKIPARNIEAGATTISVKDLDEQGGLYVWPSLRLN